MNTRFQKTALACILSFAAVFVAQAWVNPESGSEAPLVSKMEHQEKRGDLNAADVIVKSFRNVLDAGYARPYRGEFLSQILQPQGLEQLDITFREKTANCSNSTLCREGGAVAHPLSRRIWSLTQNCEQGEVLFMCTGALDFRGGYIHQTGCSAQDCGLVGVEPIDAAGRNPNENGFGTPTGCRTTIFTQFNGPTGPSVKAVCGRKAFRRWPG